MLDGVILLWFVLAAPAVAFVAIDIGDAGMAGMAMGGMAMDGKPSPSVATMTVLSFVALAAGLALAFAG
jgi:DNA-binding LytR/AlgR family response regulator